MYMNGINTTQINYAWETEQGIVWNHNVKNASTWELNITDFKWKERSIMPVNTSFFFDEDEDEEAKNQTTVVFASAYRGIKLPSLMFNNLSVALNT